MCAGCQKKKQRGVSRKILFVFSHKNVYIHIVCLKYKGTHKQMLNLWKHTLVVIKTNYQSQLYSKNGIWLAISNAYPNLEAITSILQAAYLGIKFL